ncbi:hypothetical protein [Natronobacterium gregoryi]|uniref:Uncharacterized protein n=2 Tax=Natronobacterium gregoryi TaxID=44930 RepID=L0AED1_NATGS|nr:hypothetical protein [Natronobacterium gregoryi]AFZ72181.1 hypothetical protein Natgr_0950 [Natronobacterium gregoryi SP2]ELY63044.1 hypothetical protein C490_16516 [Natronobacterium gregoryi SP2]PLK20125.1 hypothetical protein CYV19_11280 [Natronobacterium gregoryi SP2]SFJ32633.1 hypothetical protein SAMN05443661_12222 [Natronobacterium gregoryi]
MPIENLLPEFLQPSETVDENGVLRECRHCGSKFDEPVDRCRVCDSSEIATYEFVGDEDGEEEEGEGD